MYQEKITRTIENKWNREIILQNYIERIMYQQTHKYEGKEVVIEGVEKFVQDHKCFYFYMCVWDCVRGEHTL